MTPISNQHLFFQCLLFVCVHLKSQYFDWTKRLLTVILNLVSIYGLISMLFIATSRTDSTKVKKIHISLQNIVWHFQETRISLNGVLSACKQVGIAYCKANA